MQKPVFLHTIAGMDKSIWTKTPFIIFMTFICCFLWGSAFPCIKTGYRLFAIASDDTAGQILFAGVRFTLAGLLVVVVGSLVRGRFLKPKKDSSIPVLILALFQTAGQYVFFYAGMAHTTGVKSAILVAAGNFITILIAALLFHYEKLTFRKILGCLVGFAGVVLIQLPGGLDTGFRMNGEGFILLSTVLSSFSSAFVKRYSGREDPLVLSGWQFVAGGLMLTFGGLLGGGTLTGFTPASVLLLFYMACISAGAFSLWSMLVVYNDISRIAVFRFMNPVIGVILSALILEEQNQAFTVYGLGAMVLVSMGIIVVNRKSKVHGTA